MILDRAECRRRIHVGDANGYIVAVIYHIDDIHELV